MDERQLYGWRDWYKFARDTLGHQAQEATEYANLRYVEELNRRAQPALPQVVVPADEGTGA